MEDPPSAKQVDCVIPVHEKDFESLKHTVASIRRCCSEVRRIIVVSASHWDGDDTPEGAAAVGDIEFLSEDDAELWPFQRSDLEGCGSSPGWLLQQLIKLYAPLRVPGISPTVLVCDADVVWLGEAGGTHFVEGLATCSCTFDSDSCPPIRSSVDLHRYDSFLAEILPGLQKLRPGKETAVCHHACLQREVVQGLISGVEAAHPGAPFWAAFRDAAQRCGGRASEYELYHAFARRHFPDRIIPRQLTFAVVGDLEAALRSPPAGAAFLVAHSHLRGLSAKDLEDREGIINGDMKAEIVRRMVHGCPAELAGLIVGSGML